ncbi:MAG: inositol 2-dehydrogenase [Chloroflexota bacterium]|nr:inositol 2-dehydrogenase [Chloroflexota bacterium]
MTTIGFGIVGLGRIGWLHAEHIAGAVPGARLVAAAVDEAQRRELEASGRAPCPLVADVADLVARPDVEAVIVASPSSLHHDHIIEVARAGKPVFAEKPIADSVEAARAVVAAVERSGVPFQIGFQRRYDPGYVRARELIAAGAIGEVEMFRGITCDRIPPVDFLRTSGGLFWDLAIHDFDATRFLTGDEIEAVHATGAIKVEPRLAEFDDIDHGIVTLRFQSGALGVVQACWRAPAGYDIRAEVHGSRGKVVAEVDEKFPARLYDERGLVAARHDQFTERFREAYRDELQGFVTALRRGSAPTPNLTDALRAVEIADAATRSRRQGGWVTVGQ